MTGAMLKGELSLPSGMPRSLSVREGAVFFAVFALVFGWLAAALASPRIGLVLVDTGGVYTLRWFIGSILLTMALTLFGFVYASQQSRLRWMAMGLVIHTLGSTLFGDVLPRQSDGVDLQTGLYGLLITRGTMVALTAVGLLLTRPPDLTVSTAAGITVGYLVAVGVVAKTADALPALTVSQELPAPAMTGPPSGFTWLYWCIAAAISLLAIATMVMVAMRYRLWKLEGWVVVVTILLAAATTHTAFRPSLFGISVELTTANILMTLLGLLIVLGSMFSLRSIADAIAAERDALAMETRRLADLERLRADFTTMVSHELVQPLLTIRRTAESMQLARSLPPDQQQAFAAIASEATTLFALIDDVRASALTRSEDFSLDIVRTDLADVFERARLFAGTLPGRHELRVEAGVSGECWADPTRIDQVLKNLLDNAHRYTPRQATIVLRSVPVGTGVARIEVEDDGPGVDPTQVQQIFEKYGRGSSGEPGVGVGLYLSRRILQNCGSDLHYRPGAMGGACFWFDLPRVSARSTNLDSPR